MSRWNLKKVLAFLLTVFLVMNISIGNTFKLSSEVWADPLSPENAITFTANIGSVERILLIGNEHYVIAKDTGYNMCIYKLDISAKALTRVCNVSSLIPGDVTSFNYYTKIGSSYRFIFSKTSGESGDRNIKISIISSTDMQNFVLSKSNAISINYPYSCNLSYSEADGYFFMSAVCTLQKKSEEGYYEKDYLLYTSANCVNWTLKASNISAIGEDQVNIYQSQTIGSTNQQVVLTRGYWYDYDRDSGSKDYFWEYCLYTINGSNASKFDSAEKAIWRDSADDDYEMQSQDEEIHLENYGRFAFVLHDEVYLYDPEDSSGTNVEYRDISLYYGTNKYNCGYAYIPDGKTILKYYDDGIYRKKIAAIDGYLYYVYNPDIPLPAGSYKLNVIIGGTSMVNRTVLSLTDYSSSTYFTTPTTLYLSVTHTDGRITYYKIVNGISSTITDVEYNNANASVKKPLSPPTSEYQAQGYSLYYVDSAKAIFFNSSAKAFKIIYENSIPIIAVTIPSQNAVFSSQHTTVVPQISVSDLDNNALTCKYYLDAVLKETKTIAGNTAAPQIVSFTALNMGVLSEGSHTMKFEANDGFLTAEATVNFTVDKTPPNISNFTASSTASSITIAGSALDTVAGMDALPYRYIVTDGTSTYQSVWKADTTYTQGSLKPNRNYTVKLQAKDKVGNIAQKSATAYTKAQIPTLTASSNTTTTMDIAVSDSNPSNTQYQISVGTKYVSSTGVLATMPQWITLTNKKIVATGLMPNTTYSIRAKAKNGANEETGLSTAITRATLPAVPENITAQPDKYFIILTWSAMPGITRYEVSADGQIINNGASTVYIHEDILPNTQHSYKVRAVNIGGAGAWSSTIMAVTIPDPPEVPVNLRAEAAQNVITLAWDPVEGAINYDVEADGSLKENITGTTYTHNGLLPNTPHTYRVRARNRGGVGEWSDILNKDTLPEPPGMPEGFQITGTTKGTITLSWNSVDKAEGYDIEADGAIIGSTTETSYIHTGLTPDTEHTYRIRARNRGGESGWTAAAIIKTLPEKPSIPNNLTATSETKEITLSWDNAERAAEYDIEADGVIIATITGTSYIHEGLTPDTKHTYRIKARNIGGESDYSAMVTAYTLSETTGMALTNVAAVVTNTSITLMWDAVAADTEYDIEVDGEIKDNGKNTIYIHSALQPVTSHTYKIRPKKGEEKGPWCAVLAISTLPNPPDAPSNIRAIVTNTTIQLMWDAEEGATSYDIEIDGKKVESTTDTIYIHKELTPGTEHSYRIRAVNIAGATPWSEAIVKSTIKPTYMIEAEAGEEYHVALTAMGMQEFKGKKLVLKYNPEEAEIVDLCEETRGIELISGKIPGTNIMVNHTAGKIEIEADRMIEPGKSWTGVVNTILIRSKVDGVISLDYSVE